MSPRLYLAMWSALIAALLLTAIEAVPAFAAGSEKAQPAYERALRFREAHDLRAARVELLNAIQTDPNWPQARIAQADTLLRLFDARGAEAELQRAIALGIDPAAVRHLLGHAYWLQGRNDEAREQLEAGDIPVRHGAYAFRILARVYMEQGDLDAAGRALDEALTHASDSSETWTEIARFRYVSGAQAEAIEAVAHAVELDPDNVRALEFRGRLVRSQYGLRAALPWFERALAVDAGDVPVLEEYGATLGDLGRHREMLAVARKILTLQTNNPRAFYMQAVIAARAGDYGLAQRLLDLSGPPDRYPAALLLSGVVDYERGNFRRATEHFANLLNRQPHNNMVRNLLASALYRTGEHQRAIDVIRGLAGRDDADVYSRRLAARALEAKGYFDNAMEMLDRAADPFAARQGAFEEGGDLGALQDAAANAPGDAQAVLALVRALMLSGENGWALDLATDLRDRLPGTADAHMLVGDIQMERGDYLAASQAYEAARRIDFSPPLMMRIVELGRRAGDTAYVRETLSVYLYFNPTSIPARRMMADEMLAAGEWADAARLLRDLAAVVGPNDSMLQAGLARALIGTGDTGAALHAARIAYHVQPGNPVATQIYGQALLEQGKRGKDAVDVLEKAVTLSPRNPLARFHLGRAYAAVGEKRKAALALRTALGNREFTEHRKARALLAAL